MTLAHWAVSPFAPSKSKEAFFWEMTVSDIDLKQLDSLSREDLIARAAALGVTRPELLTRVELRDEIVRVSETDEAMRQRARGWFGVARDLVASVVEQRLNLPDAADLIRGVNVLLPRNVPPVATVTLAEIYAVQGHVKRALRMLDEVLEGEPEHEAARRLRQELVEQMNSERTPRPVEAAEEREEFAEEPTSDAEAVGEEAAPEVEAAPDVEAAPVNEAPVNDAAEAQTSVTEIAPVNEAPVNDVADTPMPVDEATAAEAASNDTAPVSEAQSRVQSSQPVAADVPSVLVYRRTGSVVTCHWSLDEKVWDECSALGNGQWMVRLVQVTPSVTPREPAQSDVPLPGTSGEVLFNGVPPEPQIRMALGWAAEGCFIPVAIGVEMAGDDASSIHVAWSPVAAQLDPPVELLLMTARNHWQELDGGSGT